MNNRQVVEEFARAMSSQDLDAHGELIHPDVVVRYPQSGETIRGRETYQSMLASYPGGLGQTDVFETLGGNESVHVVSPLPFTMPTITVSGSGDTFMMEGVAEYPDEGLYHVAVIVQVRGGKIASAAFYFAPPFDPPAWRAPFVGQ